MKIKLICENCGAEQKKDKVDKNWDIFNTKKKCKCGGKFILKLNKQQ